MAKVGETLKFRDHGVSVEEARKQMLAAGEAPRGILGETNKNAAVLPAPPTPAPKAKLPTSAKLTVLTEDGSDGDSTVVKADSASELDAIIKRAHGQAFAAKTKLRVDFLSEEETAAPVVGTPVVVPAAEVTSAPAKEDQVERVENAKYAIEIKQEDGDWVAEITYKNGAGAEKFIASSRRELMLKLAEGKANGTLRVRESIRREKYGTDLDKVYTLPDYMTQEAYDALPREAQFGMLDTLATQHALLLHQEHPEFYIDEENSIKIQKFLTKRDLPFTAKNMAWAYEELSDAEELNVRPTQKTAPSVSVPAAPAVDSAVPAASAPVASAPVVQAAPAVQVRKRGTTGLQPSQSSAGNSELDTTEDRSKPRELSEAELRKTSPVGQAPSADLKRAYQESLAARKRNRQF